MNLLRRIPPITYVALGFVALAVWGRDIRGVYIAAALALAVGAQRALQRSAARKAAVVQGAESRRPEWLDDVVEAGVWLLLIFGVVGGALAGWLAAGNMIATLGAAVMGGVVALLLGGVLALLVSAD